MLSSPATRSGRLTRHQLGAAYIVWLAVLSSNALSPLYVIYQQQWHFSSLTVTAVFATYALAVLVSLLTAGRLSDRYGRKRVIVPAAVLLAASATIFLLAGGVGALFVGRAVQGIATGMLTSAVTATLVELDAAGDHRRASLVNTCAFVSGAATGPLLFGLCAQYLPDPTVVPFAVELGLVALAIPVLVAMPETVRPSAPGDVQVSLLARPRVPAQVRRSFAVAGLVVAVSWSIGALYAALGPTLTAQLLHQRNHAAAGIGLFVFNILGGVSQVGLRRWPSQAAMTAGVVALGTGIGLVWASLLVASTVLFLAGTVSAGLGGGLAFMGSLRLVNEIAPPHRRAEVVSAYNMVGYLALAVPVVAVGALTGPLGLLAATGLFAAVVILAALVAVIAVRTHPADALGHLTDCERHDLGLGTVPV